MSRIATALAAHTGWLVVGAAAAATYLGALPNGFVSDAASLIPKRASHLLSDPWYVWFLRSYFWHPSGLDEVLLYRPVTTLSYVVTARLAGIPPLPFVVGNVLFHAAASALVYGVGRRLVGAEAALLAGFLFALHPLHAEAVAWIGGRPDLLATVFSMLSVLAFLRATEAGSPRPRAWAVLAAVGYLAAILSKEPALTLPGWFVLAWLVERGRRSGRRTALILGLCGLAFLAFSLLEALAHQAAQARAHSFAARMLDRLGESWLWLGGFAVIWKYTALFFWPHKLTFDYTAIPPAWREAGVPALEVALGGAVIAGFLLAVGWAVRAQKGLALALLWIPVTYFVVSGFPLTPQLVIAERFTYLPSAGACLAAGWGLLRAGQIVLRSEGAMPGLFPAAWPGTRGWARGVAVTVIVLGLLVALEARTVVRNRDWRTDDTVFTAALTVSPDSPLALAAYGKDAHRRGDYERARTLLEEALRLNPVTPDAYVFLAAVYANDGEPERIIGLVRTALAKIRTRDLGVVDQMVNLVWRTGLRREAESLYREIVARYPRFLPARLALGRILLGSGRVAEALAEFETVARVRPDDPRAWSLMARAAQALGREEEAHAYRARAAALRRGPQTPQEGEEADERQRNGPRDGLNPGMR